MIHLTLREWNTLTVIQQHFVLRGHAPTMREIATALGRSCGGGIENTLAKLEGKGVIRRHAQSKGRREGTLILVRGVRIGVMP